MNRRGRFSSITPWSKWGRSLPTRSRYVPRIADELTDIAIYLYQSQEHAEAGSEIGGSGFIVGIPVEGEPDKHWLLAVTNRHVIEQGNTFVRLNNRTGATSVFEVPEPQWIFHPDEQDLAVGPMRALAEYHRFRCLPLDAVLTKEKLAELDVGIGTDTFMVGRFVGRDGGQTNIPTVRFGHVAQMPTFIKNEFGKAQESYLVETRSIGGYSGSPVFGYKQPFQLKAGAAARVIDNQHWGPALLGVDWGHSGQVECVFDASGRELQMYVESNTGLSLVIPSWRLLELLNSDALKQKLLSKTPEFGSVDLNLPETFRVWPDD